MSSIQSYFKEPTSLRRQFTVYPDYTAGQNQYFTVNNGILYRTQADLSGVDYIVARDMGKEMTITDIDPSILDTWFDGLASNIKVVRKGTARKFQVLSMGEGSFFTTNLYFANDTCTSSANAAGNGTAFGDYQHSNGLYKTNGNGVAINDLLIVGSDSTVTTSTTQTLPFGTFWAVNDPIVISYLFSDVKKHRAIKNRIDETTLF
jgi:hypothetical protein